MIAELKSEVGEFETPEHVNNSEQTAPSKRIKRIFGSYQKTIDGISVAQAIGIETMMKTRSAVQLNGLRMMTGNNVVEAILYRKTKRTIFA